MKRWLPVAVAVVLVGASCSGTDAARPNDTAPDFLVEKLGGTTSAREFRGRPFNQSARSLNNAEFKRFGAGAIVFDQHFTADQGLGPLYIKDSCLSCHLDGEQFEDHTKDDPGPGLLLRLSVPGVDEHGGPVPEPTYGLQLQTDATDGAVREGDLNVTWKYMTGHYPDGTRYELRAPTFSVTHLSKGPLASDVLTSARIAPPMTGLGLLEAIPVATLEAAADPDDANHDGISGRVNMVWDDVSKSMMVGRFGWKGDQPTVRQQSTAALAGDMGISTPDVPGTVDTGLSATPDMNAIDLADQVFYNRTIAVPIARNVTKDAVVRGANRFADAGCSACHTTTQKAGDDEVAGIAHQTFHPFTDLLLHDMGPGLADERPVFAASGSEWRTAPLWAFGRRAEVTKFDSFLHDGRARNGEEAILWHDGEAAASRKRFMAMSKADRSDLLAFLRAL